MSTACATSVTVMRRRRLLPFFGPSELVTRMMSFQCELEDDGGS